MTSSRGVWQKWRGEGVWKPRILDDVICERSLNSILNMLLLFHNLFMVQDLFKEEYDKVKIKEYIRLMEENKVDGSVIEPTDNFVDSRLFTNK